MLKRSNRLLAFVLSIALVFTTFGSDFASAVAYAEDDAQQSEGITTWDDIVEEVPGAQDDREGSDDAASGESDAASEDAQSEDTPANPDEGEGGAVDVPETPAPEEPSEGGSIESPSEASTESAADEASAESSEDAAEASSEASSEAASEASDQDETEAASEATSDDAASEAGSVEEKPAIEVNGVRAGGMVVSVYAEAGVFPKGTEVSITAISDSQAMATAEETLGKEVASAKGVDITFIYEGNEIQPEDAKYVHVNLALDEAIEKENLTVLHNHGDGVEQLDAAVEADSEGNAQSVSFDVDHFSIFIIVDDDDDDNGDTHRYVITYKFYVPGASAGSWLPFEGHEEQYLKSGDTLYYPGTPPINPDNNEEFNGWFTMDADGYFPDSNKVEFGPVDEITENKEVKVYANITTTYYVTFVGTENDVVKVKRQEGTKGQPAPEIKVNDVKYAVKAATQAFLGWTTEKDNDATLINNTVDPSVTKVVYAYVTDAFWIHFDENDDTYDEKGNKIESGGASFTGPVAIDTKKTPGEVLNPIPTPSRPGYEFDGWYNGTRDPDTMAVTLEGPFEWDKKLTDNVTVFAKWKEKTSAVKYYVNVWKQNAENDSYYYDSSASFEETAAPNSRITFGTNIYRVGTSSRSYPSVGTGFKIFDKKAVDGAGNPTVIIGAKEDTVINLYYNRNTYTLHFQEYYSGFGGGWKDVYTITERYGRNISGHFPIKVGDTVYNNEWRVETDSVTYSKGNRISKIENMPPEDITFHKVTGGSKHAIFVYYREDLDGSYDAEYNGYKFDENNTVEFDCDQSIRSTKDEEFMVIDGFERFAADPEYGPDGKQDIVHNKPIKLYYTRKKYPINFMDGDSPLGKLEDIPYEQKLSEYADEINAISVADKSGQKFVGWYLDKTCTEPFVLAGAIMPLNGLTVYAKFADIEFNVLLNLDGGTFDGETDFWVKYGDKVDANELTQKAHKDEWELVGWFYEEGPKAGQAYDFDRVIESCTPLKYDPDYGTYSGTVKLIAGWRFPGLVYIKYDAGANGSDAPDNDHYGYAYDSSVVVDKPSKPNSGFNFIGWVIDTGSLEYDKYGDVIAAEDDVLYPNGSFTINRSYVTKDGEKEYITLVAVYEKIGAENSSTETTTITYDANDGTGTTLLVDKIGGKDLRVNQSVEVFTLEGAFGSGYKKQGYKFLGWDLDKNASAAGIKPGQAYTIAADNEDKSHTNTKANILYAIWEKDESQTQPTWYKVQHDVAGEIKDSKTYEGTAWINDDPAMIEVEEGSLKENTYQGYKFAGYEPTTVKEGDKVKSGTIITLKYVKDETKTQATWYKVQHDVAGEIKDSKTYEGTAWINDDPAMIEIEEGSLKENTYQGYKCVGYEPEAAKEGEKVKSGTIITLKYVKDETKTQGTWYKVQHDVAGEIKDSKTYEGTAFINDDPAMIEVEPGSLKENEYKGYKYIGMEPATAKEGAELESGTVITLKYVKDETQTKDLVYTVNHVIGGEIKDTADVTAKVWVGDPDKVKVSADSIKPNTYEGYEVTKVVNADGGAEIKAEDEVDDKTVINIIYEPITVKLRYEYRSGEGVTLPSDLPALPEAFDAKYGDEIDLIDVPTYKGYSFTEWTMEKVGSDTGELSFIAEIFGSLYSFLEGTKMTVPAYDAVIYTTVTKNATPAPPAPTPDDPTPAPPGPTPDPAPSDPAPSEPTPVAPVEISPVAGREAVLGARREVLNSKALLGARRGRTDDDTNTSARTFATIVAAAAAISLFFVGKKKEEEEEG
jgi:uncharacterized repeat protein (TIGR02543 family)